MLHASTVYYAWPRHETYRAPELVFPSVNFEATTIRWQAAAASPVNYHLRERHRHLRPLYRFPSPGRATPSPRRLDYRRDTYTFAPADERR